MNGVTYFEEKVSGSVKAPFSGFAIVVPVVGARVVRKHGNVPACELTQNELPCQGMFRIPTTHSQMFNTDGHAADIIITGKRIEVTPFSCRRISCKIRFYDGEGGFTDVSGWYWLPTS